MPDHWIDSLFPEVRRILQLVQARNARLQSGKRHADDNVSDRAAEGSYRLCCMGAFVFGRTCLLEQEGEQSCIGMLGASQYSIN